MPQLDAPVEGFRLTAADGGAVELSELLSTGPVVLAMLEDDPVPAGRLEMLRVLGRTLSESTASLVLVTSGDAPTAQALAVESAARCLADVPGAVFSAFGLVERRIARTRRRGGVFIIDGAGVLRFSYSAHRDDDWVPLAVVLGRLQRLGVEPSGDATAAPAPTPPETAIEGGDEIEVLSRHVGESLGMSADELAELATAARVRDLGMATVPDEIITKIGPLTDEEWAVIRRHPERSADMLGEHPELEPVRRIVRANHEHLDGSGYPNGLSAPEIPVGSRILLVVEAYVAMTQDRPYRPHLAPHEAVEVLEEQAGSAYDAETVAALVRVLRELPAVDQAA
jgi:peroxiredoxin